MKVCISGAGVAGPTLAYWLDRAGHTPVLVETAPTLRDGGYMIDFWGVGYTVAERMGLLPQICAAGYDLDEVRYINADGRTAGSISARSMSRELGGRFTSLPRGELASIIHGAIRDRVETRFGVTVEAMQPAAAGIDVRLSDGSAESFDLVVGADGLHSRVRVLAFGPQAQFERDLGYFVAAFEADGYRPRDELAYVSLGLPGRQLSRFAERDDRTMFLLVFAAERLEGTVPEGLAARKALLARVFEGSGWEWPQISAALEAAPEVYFDRVSQIVADRWSSGRSVLIGDAAACVSLVAGEGTGLAMTEAYVLAGELASNAEPLEALICYEARLRRFVDGKQKAARAFANSFTPKTAFGVWFRNQAVRMLALPGASNLLLGPQLKDDFELPDYGL
jgi:2-polyprenyl-6-methoxyphenol hydroxylase-like FAD-dependent oxidoreductase